MQDEITLLNEKLDYLNDGNRKLHGLYDDRGKQIQSLQNKLDISTKQTEKLKNDKIKLKGHLKVTRDNNGLLKNMVDELKTENEEIEVHLQQSNAKVESLTSEIELMKKSNEELTKKTEELDGKIENLKKMSQNLFPILKIAKVMMQT